MVLSGALSMLWNIFNTLQLITAFDLLQVGLPANVQVLQESLKDTVNFAIVPKDKLYDAIIVPILHTSTTA